MENSRALLVFTSDVAVQSLPMSLGTRFFFKINITVPHKQDRKPWRLDSQQKLTAALLPTLLKETTA